MEKPLFCITELSEERSVRGKTHSSPTVGSGSRLGSSRWHHTGPTVGLLRREPLSPQGTVTDFKTSQDREGVRVHHTGLLPAVKPLLPRAAGGKLGTPNGSSAAAWHGANWSCARRDPGCPMGRAGCVRTAAAAALLPCSKCPPATPALQTALHPHSKHVQ